METSRKVSTIAQFIQFEMSNALRYNLSLLLEIKGNKSTAEANRKEPTIAEIEHSKMLNELMNIIVVKYYHFGK